MSGRPFLLVTFLWASKEKPPAASVAEAVDLDLGDPAAHPEQASASIPDRRSLSITIKGFRLRRVPFVLAKGTKTARS
ncbi:hypothetical protein [Marilutibacter maris]|uniref:hypothetical protein n=1 Tax=Marilutibacter maris TaxID=1605891 RepID=UPI0011AE78A4|nr:hypothetical protein [Lysobacter maris]